ncbi:class I SAM-dependent methyltransferase [Saccharopolyspora rosea]|uniref:Class I SAM-dependent methyltransferase n=1 Tax=Saccharopolyspora rosea TaxID=524884 RepID=A0ABW3FW17_9PSEU
MTDRTADLAAEQRGHWQRTYRDHPDMYGTGPSDPARYAASRFPAGARVVDLGAGHGRDSLFFARRGFAVTALDFSAEGLDQLRRHAAAEGLDVTALAHDVRDPLPLADGSADAVYAHMLLCMALTTAQLHALVAEIRRVLVPGGVFVYTVRHTGDAHYGVGTAHGDDIYETGGFAVHFFDRPLVDDLAADWTLEEVLAFEEGELPRRLWRVTQVR